MGHPAAEAVWAAGSRTGLPGLATVTELRILPLVDAEVSDGLRAEHGVSYLVVADGQTLLFDLGLSAGRRSKLVHNAQALGVDVAWIDLVVLSHAHPDHCRGPRAWPRRSFALPGREAPRDSGDHPGTDASPLRALRVCRRGTGDRPGHRHDRDDPADVVPARLDPTPEATRSTSASGATTYAGPCSSSGRQAQHQPMVPLGQLSTTPSKTNTSPPTGGHHRRPHHHTPTTTRHRSNGNPCRDWTHPRHGIKRLPLLRWRASWCGSRSRVGETATIRTVRSFAQ